MTYVAAIQMVSTDAISKNLELAERLIEEAVSKKAKLITLPENFPLIGKRDEDRLAITESHNDGPLQLFLSEQSKRYKVWLLGGTIPLKSNNPEKVFATSLLFNPSGDCIARYDKIHLFDVMLDGRDEESYRESKTFESGNDVVVVKTEIGNIGLSVCYDLRFPEMYRKMHQKNVQIITAPSAFTATTGKAHWETLLRTRAIENLCYLIASNQGGIHVNGRETWGHSMIVDPWGEILAEVKEEIGVAIAKIEINKQTNLRKRFPTLTHRKLDYKIDE
jgi:nitrilase|tara:strand:- start:253 stop:1083 length:831 start_codon:yes stop_codon:yes gene_type:complete